MGGGIGVITEALRVPLLSCESAVINTMMKTTSLPITLSRKTEHELTHGFWKQHRPRTPTCSPVSDHATDLSMVSCTTKGINRVFCPARAMDTIIALGNNTSQGHQHDLRWQHRSHNYQFSLWQHNPWITTWLQAAAQTINMHVTFKGNVGHGHQHWPCPKMVVLNSTIKGKHRHCYEYQLFCVCEFGIYAILITKSRWRIPTLSLTKQALQCQNRMFIPFHAECK